MKVIGLTGGIGSGKTTVALMFQELGVPLFIADDVSKKILATDLDVRAEIRVLLGDQSFKDQNGLIIPDKKFIASQVFTDSNKLNQLNDILHPRVRQSFEQWLKLQDAPYVIYEAAILFESGGDSICDSVIMVTAPEDDRVARVVARDNTSEAEVRNRLQNQWSDLQRLEKSNYVIVNKDLHKTELHVNRLHEIMLKS